MGKGSKSRITDHEKYRKEYERIFGKQKKKRAEVKNKNG